MHLFSVVKKRRKTTNPGSIWEYSLAGNCFLMKQLWGMNYQISIAKLKTQTSCRTERVFWYMNWYFSALSTNIWWHPEIKRRNSEFLCIDSSFLATYNHFCPWSVGRYEGWDSNVIEVSFYRWSLIGQRWAKGVINSYNYILGNHSMVKAWNQTSFTHQETTHTHTKTTTSTPLVSWAKHQSEASHP